MLELYHWEPNTYYLKPLIALKEKQVAFNSRYFDATRFEQFRPGFPSNTESNLHLEREGPVLVHDDTIISSSFFMLEYIADAFPGLDLQHARRRLCHDQHRAVAGLRNLVHEPLLEQAREDVVGIGATDAGLARDVAHRRLTELERCQIEAHFRLVQTDVRQSAFDGH